MARKNLIEVSTPLQLRPETGATTGSDRPIAGLTPRMRAASPVGGITKTLGNITEKVERAQDLERQLAAGQTIVEIDPTLIDGSFVKDRLEIDPADLSMLVEQIREHGQQVPILVRPHPSRDKHYQAAYGHRRLRAAAALGRPVRAIVKTLTDEEVILAQGQENSARVDLSFIERALFARRMQEHGFDRETISRALSVDKPEASRLLQVADSIPTAMILAIGPAPKVGRPRWLALADRLKDPALNRRADREMRIADFGSADTNARFERLWKVTGETRKKEKATETVRTRKGQPLATIEHGGRGAKITVTSGEFAAFLSAKMPDIVSAFERENAASSNS